MPRPERALDPADGPVERFAVELRRLRHDAGNPSYRKLAERAGYSATTLADAAAGRRLPSLPVVRGYVQACGADPSVWEERWRQVAQEVATDHALEEEPEQPPYPGLASFQTEDAERFFGRDRLVAKCTERLAEGGLLTIVGASGSGKSSVLRAGLIPALVSAEGGKSGAECRAECAYHVVTPGPWPLKVLDELPSDLSGTLLAVDQFEELFTLCHDEAQQDGFIDALLDAVAASAGVVIALRSDFYGHCARFPRLAKAVERSTVLCGPMTAKELARAITGPASLAGLTVERALVTKVQADALGEPGALPMVSHALQETWRLRQGQMLTLAAYEAAGGVDGAIACSADQVYDSLDPDLQRTARRILIRLTALGEGTEDTRRRVERSELDFDGGAEVIERLVAARLLVMNGTVAELAHEALIRCWPRLRMWLTEDRETLRTHRQLTEAAAIWSALGRDKGALLRGARLALTRERLSGDHRAELTPDEKAFLEAGVEAETAETARERRRARRLRTLAGALAVLLVVALGSGGVAALQWRSAVAERQHALSRQMAVQALQVAPTDVPEGARLALDAYRAAPTLEARGAVLSLAGKREYAGRLRLGGMVRDAVFDPAGSGRVALASLDGLVTIWDVRRRVTWGRLGKPGDPNVRVLAWHPKGSGLIAAGDFMGRVTLWDLARRERVWSVPAHGGKPSTVVSGPDRKPGGVAFSPDGELLASVGGDHRIFVWRVTDGAKVMELRQGRNYQESRLVFSPDGRRLITTGNDGVVAVWDLAGRKVVRELDTGSAALNALALSADGRRLAAAGDGLTVTVWDPVTGERKRTLAGHTGPVRGLAFSADSHELVSAGDDKSVIIWDVERATWLARLAGHTSQIYRVAVSPDGEWIASAGREQIALLWQRSRLPLLGAVREVGDLVISPEHTTIVASSTAGPSIAWDLRTRRWTPSGEVGGSVTAVGLRQPADRPYLASKVEETVVLWDAARRRPVKTLSGPSSRVIAAALSPDQTLVAGGDLNKNAYLWDTRTGKLITTVRREGEVRRVAFTDAGATLMIAASDGKVGFWDVGSRTMRRVLDTGSRLVQADLSRDGRLLATAHDFGRIVLWDVTTGKRVGELRGRAEETDKLAFSPDRRFLASVGKGRSVVLWDVAGRTRWADLTGHSSGVAAVAWSPDGGTLYTGGVDRVVNAWPVRPERAITGLCRDLRAEFPDAVPGGCATRPRT